MLRRDGPDLRDGHGEVGQHLQEECFELVVGAVELVDEEHRGLACPQRGEERALDKECLAEEILDVPTGVLPLERADRDKLSRVVPLVQRL